METRGITGRFKVDKRTWRLGERETRGIVEKFKVLG
jgi:hypothetical protein